MMGAATVELYEQLAERHGHYCPMSTLGVRLAEMAQQTLAARGLKDWQFCYLARTCAADGIRIIFEQSRPGFELTVEQQGQHRLQCRATDGALLSFVLSEQAMQLAAGYRDLPEEQKPQRLDLLRTAPVEQLVDSFEG